MPAISFSGLASGIDSKSLIDALIESRELVNKQRQQEIDHLSSENDALDELNTKLLAFNDLVDPLRTVNGGGISKRATSSDAEVLTAVAGGNAAATSYDVTVTSIAAGATASFNQTYSSLTSKVSTSGSGTVSFNVGTGSSQKTVSATVTSGSTTVQDFVDALNSDPDAPGNFVASAVNVGTSSSPSYKILISTLKQGTDSGQLSISAAAGITELQASTLNQASDAVFSVSGIAGTFTRSSNAISDIIPNLSFQLNKAGSAKISISNDADGTVDQMTQIVDAFNDLVKYLADNNIVEQDKESKDRSVSYGSLAKSRLDEDFMSVLRQNIASATTASGTTISSFADMGLVTNRDGTISLDEDKFKEAVSEDSVGAAGVLNNFADSVAGVNGSIYQYTRFQGLISIAQDSNTTQIENLNDAIATVERQSVSVRSNLEKTFANLESISAKLQGQSSALSSIIGSLR